MNENLIIIGARAMGRQVYNYARDSGFVIKGFLDSKENALDGFCNYPPILGSVEDYIPCKNDVFVCAIGEPKYREYYANLMYSKGAKFVSVIHPSAYVGLNVDVGEGSIICPNAILTCDLKLGRHVIVNIKSSVSHDCVIGDYCSISPGSTVAGRVCLGKSVFLGIGVNVIPDVEIGSSVIVGAGAVVTKSWNEGILVGIPAKSICLKKA